MHHLVALVPWLRWLPCLALLLAGSTGSEPHAPAPAAASRGHAWLVRSWQDRWLVDHVAMDDERPVRMTLGRHDDRPVSLACEDDRLWIAFAPREGRSEVLTARVARNPASDLWFVVPPGVMLCSSLPTESEPALAAHAGQLWAIEGESRRIHRLRGSVWERVEPPDDLPGMVRVTLAHDTGSLWLLTQGEPSRRWRWNGQRWDPVPWSVPAWSGVVSGMTRLALVAGQPSQAGSVQAGAFVPEVVVPPASAITGWAGGLAAWQVRGETLAMAVWKPGSPGFEEWSDVPPQASAAARWFHVPLLGVLSIGALLLAFMLRSIFAGLGVIPEADVTPMPLQRRAVALAIDAAPLGLAAGVALDASVTDLLTPPVWTLDVSRSLAFAAMTCGTVVFGFLEESVGGRSLGKWLLGGRVVRRDGVRAAWWRHLLRNILKGLLMLSPVVAIPTLLHRRGEGVPEAISLTSVVQMPGPAT
jgi:uncharacterized RDD family membrane protein YckC